MTSGERIADGVGGGVGGGVEEGPVATTWELSQPQGPSSQAISGANASWRVGKVE